MVLFTLGVGISGASAAPVAALHIAAPGCNGVTVNAPGVVGGSLTAADAGMAAASPLLDKANAAHTKWVTNISCTSEGVRDHHGQKAPNPAATPDAKTTPSGSGGSYYNWSGYDTDASTAYYADMEWYQSTVTIPAGTNDAYSCLWPGVGGENGGVMVQAGSEADRHSYLPGQTDYFWYEVWTNNSSVQTRVNGLSLTAGDDVGRRSATTNPREAPPSPLSTSTPEPPRASPSRPLTQAAPPSGSLSGHKSTAAPRTRTSPTTEQGTFFAPRTTFREVALHAPLSKAVRSRSR